MLNILLEVYKLSGHFKTYMYQLCFIIKDKQIQWIWIITYTLKQ